MTWKIRFFSSGMISQGLARITLHSSVGVKFKIKVGRGGLKQFASGFQHRTAVIMMKMFLKP